MSESDTNLVICSYMKQAHLVPGSLPVPCAGTCGEDLGVSPHTMAFFEDKKADFMCYDCALATGSVTLDQPPSIIPGQLEEIRREEGEEAYQMVKELSQMPVRELNLGDKHD